VETIGGLIEGKLQEVACNTYDGVNIRPCLKIILDEFEFSSTNSLLKDYEKGVASNSGGDRLDDKTRYGSQLLENVCVI
jgi:hypothetical protein